MFTSFKSSKIKIKGFEDAEEIFDALKEFTSVLSGEFHPAIKMQESKENYLISLAAPGQTKETFDVSVENGIISIKAEVKEKNDFIESFSKSYRLPANADGDSIKGEYKDGVLKITISKKVDQTSKKVNIG